MDVQLMALVFAVIIGLLNMIIIVVKQFGKNPGKKSYPCQKHWDKIDELDKDIGKLQVSVGQLETGFKAFTDDNKEEHRRLFRKLNREGG